MFKETYQKKESFKMVSCKLLKRNSLKHWTARQILACLMFRRGWRQVGSDLALLEILGGILKRPAKSNMDGQNGAPVDSGLSMFITLLSHYL